MPEDALTAGRDSALLTLLRSADDWETKRDALAAFAFQPVERSDGPNDDLPPATAGSWDELLDAEVAGLITAEQVDEVLALRSCRQSHCR